MPYTIDNSLAADVQVPNMMNTMGNILDFARGAQALQQGNVNLQRSRATLAADIAQRQAESARAGTEARVSAETVGPRVSEAQSSASTAATGAARSQWQLTSDQSDKALQIAGGLLQDPSVIGATKLTPPAPDATPDQIAAYQQQRDAASKDSVSALMQAEDQMRAHGIPEAQIRVQMGPLYAIAAHAPEKLAPILANIQQQGMASASQVSQGQIPAGQQQQPGGTDVAGNPTAIVKDRFGNVQQTPLPVGGAPNQPPNAAPQPAAGPMRIPPGETPQTMGELQDLRSKSNLLAQQAPSQHFNNGMILKLAPDAFTGTGTGALTKVMNAFGLQSTNNVGADTTQLQHFLALQVEHNAAAQGANTDAARALAQQATLPGQAPEKAIKAITKVNDAYVTGNELFNQGLENTVKNSPKGIFAARDFRNAWSQTMDPRIFQIENAVKNGDKAEVDRLKVQLGPQGIAQLRQKAIALKALIGGQHVGP